MQALFFPLYYGWVHMGIGPAFFTQRSGRFQRLLFLPAPGELFFGNKSELGT